MGKILLLELWLKKRRNNKLKYFKYIFILVLFGCSSSKVIYDYDLKTDFSEYKTYNFFEDAGDGMNELDIKRFVSAIETNLDSIGYKKSEKPDFYIDVISEKVKRLEIKM